MNKTICVYSSSSCTIDRRYFEVAAELGKEIARRGDILLFGGGLIGLMGATAKAVHQYGGKVIGVIPEALNVKGVVYETCDELIVTTGLRERKAVMDSRSDAFIALPGGFGTLEEILEIITLKQLKYHNKPVVIINVNGFYDRLLAQFEEIVKQRFAKPESQGLYFVTANVKEALEYIDSYQPRIFKEKWLTDVE
ncbi:MAG: TIGR00730 family Rossman fold protein [Firmicutes bacterium]|nr:TIGR00730 family Rossman fold protein [Bacillota bacterium]